MKITDIKIRKTFEEGPLRAVVSLTFDDQLALHDVKVIYARDRYFVVMPSRKNPDGTFRDMVHPINAACLVEFETAISGAYRRGRRHRGVKPAPSGRDRPCPRRESRSPDERTENEQRDTVRVALLSFLQMQS